ncbi:enoyl-CoA hydratase/isomerase family protein [Streptomyces sp. NPDC001795]|uniref:enoyl-CoA hydratase/isomerase family protein n=1 Tax=unclassified Streptomyces TaxID=2593676 RepID=UPI003322ABB9
MPQTARRRAQPAVLYVVKDRTAYPTLNRPDRLNAVDPRMPGELAAAVRRAGADPEVQVIVLQGAGRAFCSGYDLKIYAEDGQGTQGSGTGTGCGTRPRTSR